MSPQLLDQLSSRLNSLSATVRLQTLYTLRIGGAQTVSSLAKVLNQDQGLMTYHLNNLIRAGFVQTSKAGNHRIYFLNELTCQDTITAIQSFFQGVCYESPTSPANEGASGETPAIEIGDP